MGAHASNLPGTGDGLEKPRAGQPEEEGGLQKGWTRTKFGEGGGLAGARHAGREGDEGTGVYSPQGIEVEDPNGTSSELDIGNDKGRGAAEVAAGGSAPNFHPGGGWWGIVGITKGKGFRRAGQAHEGKRFIEKVSGRDLIRK